MALHCRVNTKFIKFVLKPLVEVSIDTARLTKYYDLQKRLNKYHLPLCLSFSKRHSIRV